MVFVSISLLQSLLEMFISETFLLTLVNLVYDLASQNGNFSSGEVESLVKIWDDAHCYEATCETAVQRCRIRQRFVTLDLRFVPEHFFYQARSIPLFPLKLI